MTWELGDGLEQPAAARAASVTVPRSTIPGRRPERAGARQAGQEIFDPVISYFPSQCGAVDAPPC